MSRLPQSTVDSISPDLRLQARINDLENRLAAAERTVLPGNNATFTNATLASFTDFTTPAGNYTPPVGSFGLCGWFAAAVVGPNQVWDIRAQAEISTSSATWIRTAAQHVIRDSTGAAGPSGASVTGLIFPIYSNSAGPVLPSVVTWGTLFTDSTVPTNTVVRIHLQFNNGAAGPVVVRDGNYFSITARRVA